MSTALRNRTGCPTATRMDGLEKDAHAVAREEESGCGASLQKLRPPESLQARPGHRICEPYQARPSQARPVAGIILRPPEFAPARISPDRSETAHA